MIITGLTIVACCLGVFAVMSNNRIDKRLWEADRLLTMLLLIVIAMVISTLNYLQEF